MRLLCVLFTVALSAAAAGPLAVVNPQVEQSDGGTPLPPGFAHVPGEVIFFSFQIEGYKATPQARVRLSYKIEAFDPKGVPITEPVASVVDAELAPEDKNWKPKVRTELPLPPLALTGTYKIVVHVTDEVAKGEAVREIPVEVHGRDVPPSETLVIRNLHFYRTENEREPLAQPAFRPGDTLWIGFDITGFRYGEANRIDVSYGIGVEAPGGKVLFSQPEAAVEQTQSFYPKRYVPATMSLNLEPKIRPGEYAVILTVQDRIGQQTYSTRQSFQIE